MNNSKTKIITTLGPASADVQVLTKMVKAGADAVRLNFSHGTKEEFAKYFNIVEEVCRETQLPISVLQDLQGPKIRIGELSAPEIELVKGNLIEITAEDLPGTKDIVSTSYKLLPQDANIGDRILIDDGLIHLAVTAKTGNSVICEILEGGILKPKKGMNLPGMKLTTASVTPKDLENLEFALNYRLDYVALSFVREPKDIIEIKSYLLQKGFNLPVIAKIEKKEAVDNFEDILRVSDGIMVARGDLGVELGSQDVPIIQKSIIKACNSAGKLVITATQMLESMIHNPVPTRAEASDVANAVFDGTDVVMLSGETSVGKFPVESVRIMNDILLKSEKYPEFKIPTKYIVPDDFTENIFDATGKAITNIASQISADILVVFTHFGKKAKMISKFRPSCPVVAISDSFDTMNKLNLYYGIRSYFMEDIDNEDELVNMATEILKKAGLVKTGSVVLFTAGAPSPNDGRNSWTRSAII